MTRHDMTFTALCNRADEMKIAGVVSDFRVVEPEEPAREVAVFLTQERSDMGDGYDIHAKEIIGVALCNLDDAAEPVEILSRSDAWDFFGRTFVEDMEAVE